MQLPRLMVVAWDIPGVCDIPAMTATINAHVRRHDAYHDWFEFENGVFVRPHDRQSRGHRIRPYEFRTYAR